jgi:hypothetical protein
MKLGKKVIITTLLEEEKEIKIVKFNFLVKIALLLEMPLIVGYGFLYECFPTTQYDTIILSPAYPRKSRPFII